MELKGSKTEANLMAAFAGESQARTNPCQGVLHLSLVNAQEFEYSIINMMGQTITQGHSQEQETVVDLSQSPAGVYLISAIQDGKRFVQKLVLN